MGIERHGMERSLMPTLPTQPTNHHQPEGTAMTATLIRTQRLYRLDKPLTVYSANSDEFRYVGSTIQVTWKADQPLDVELSGPEHQVFRDGEWRSIGGIGGYCPVPTDQQPEWLDGRDA